MKRFYFVLVSFCVLTTWIGLSLRTAAQSELVQTQEAVLVSPNIVISQFFGGGGSAGAPYTHDFVELFNRGSAPVSINGWSVQYASAGGSNWIVTNLPNATVAPGQYFLIQFASNGAIGSALPTPDLIAPVAMEGFIPNLSGSTGKIALVNTIIKLPSSTCPTDASIVDLVGYGDAALCFEGARTPNLSNTTAGRRNGNGCADTDNNSLDFTIVAPMPRNSASSVNACNNGGTLQISGTANPGTIAPGGNTLFTVTVFPATAPPSTGISVVGNLTNIGGSATQQFFDDGTNGDVTANDNIFSYRATVPTTLTDGLRVVPVSAADAQGRTATTSINLTIFTPAAGDDHLLLGNPSNATTNVANENNYLLVKNQYALSYNRSRATANWISWKLDSSWIGTAPRQDDFRPDPQLPAGWYQVTDADYSGSGYDRGHMVASGDRTRSIPDNSSTFLMTNIVPQLAANNQGAWEDFETYLRTLVTAGQEIYIIAGVHGTLGTIAQGRVVVPQYTWKVALILPNGSNDLQRITKGTRTVAIITPNFPPLNINATWRQFRVSVNEVENLTGYDFFTNVPKMTQEIIERRKDRL
jgi:endonuclease G, mitochondrial